MLLVVRSLSILCSTLKPFYAFALKKLNNYQKHFFHQHSGNFSQVCTTEKKRNKKQNSGFLPGNIFVPDLREQNVKF